MLPIYCKSHHLPDSPIQGSTQRQQADMKRCDHLLEELSPVFEMDDAFPPGFLLFEACLKTGMVIKSKIPTDLILVVHFYMMMFGQKFSIECGVWGGAPLKDFSLIEVKI
jgi:hypothetical protein